ncbi:MAG: adenylate/guanylate cyclase domain-containing protein [Spirochaetaceae bacterium]
MLLNIFFTKTDEIKDKLLLTSEEYIKLKTWGESATLSDIYQINVHNLADTLNIDRRKMLECFIEMAHNELVDINWQYHCPSCNGVPEAHKLLADVTHESNCQMCSITFSNTLDQNIGICFTPSEAYVDFPTEFFENNKKIMNDAINAPLEKKLELAKYLRSQTFVSGIDCIHIESFKELFDDDNLPFDQSLKIKNISILFTDIKGSTALYERVGDATAYRLIREHFHILFDIIAKYNGIVIKTIGDAVMASFKKPTDSTLAAIEIRERFKEFDTKLDSEREILVKMGIHMGSTIMVTLNKRIDYFGQTINIAARIQNEAKNNQILISEKVSKDSGIEQLLLERSISLKKKKVKLKGLTNKSNIFILRFNNN